MGILMAKAVQRYSACHLVSWGDTKEWHKVLPLRPSWALLFSPTATSRKKKGGERRSPASADLILSPCGVGVLFGQPPQSVLFLMYKVYLAECGAAPVGPQTLHGFWLHCGRHVLGQVPLSSSLQHHPLGLRRHSPSNEQPCLKATDYMRIFYFT